MKRSRISQPVIRQVQLFTSEGVDGWNIAVFRLEQCDKVLGYASLVMFMGVFEFPGGRAAGYKGQRDYDTEEEAMADREEMILRAKRFVREQGGVLVR